jgi:hypothetical protein
MIGDKLCTETMDGSIVRDRFVVGERPAGIEAGTEVPVELAGVRMQT